MEINRRKFHRIPSQAEPCSIIVDNLELNGLIANESISGASVTELELLMMPYNKALTLEYREGKMEVRARNIERTEDGKFQMGVIRSEAMPSEQLEDSAAMLVNCYVQHQEAFVICMPIHIESEDHVLIQLWDGVQFRVQRSKLKPLTRTERFEMLADEYILNYTAAMYGFQVVSPEAGQQKVFEHEFGVYENCPIAFATEQ